MCYNGHMGNIKVINFVIDPALLKRVDDFWHKQRFPNRAAAIKALLDWALKQNPKLGESGKETHHAVPQKS